MSKNKNSLAKEQDIKKCENTVKQGYKEEEFLPFYDNYLSFITTLDFDPESEWHEVTVDLMNILCEEGYDVELCNRVIRVMAERGHLYAKVGFEYGYKKALDLVEDAVKTKLRG